MTDKHEIENVINDLKNTAALGNDEIPVSVLKQCCQHLLEPLHHLINLSLSSGTFPDTLKYTIVKPLFKKGDRSELVNYRPIALVSNISKIIEKIVVKRIYNFLINTKVLNNYQNGYCRGRSTERAIFQLLEDIINGINNKDITVSVFMDLSKAFDCVNHELLLRKIESLGFRGVSLNWITSYLQGRQQSVIAYDDDGNQVKSDWAAVTRGVPQGSVLGPLLFLLYINDLPDAVDSLVVLFADDSSVVLRAKKYEELCVKLENSITTISNWSINNNLKLNLGKTKLMIFNNEVPELSVNIDGSVIQAVQEVSFLGIHVDAVLSWGTQIQILSSCLHRFSYALKTISRSVGVETALTTYYAYVHAKLKYGVMFWGNATETNQVFIAQKSCVRAVFGLGRRDSCKLIFKSKKILTFPSVYIMECALFVKKYYTDFFKKFSLQHEKNTRGLNNDYLLPPKTKLTKIQKTVLCQCLKIYNALPNSVKNLPETQFKNKIKQQLLNATLYGINDFFLENIW